MTVVKDCSLVDDTTVTTETAVVVVFIWDVRVAVVVVVATTTTASGEVAALLQAESKLLSEYPPNSVGILTTALLVTATTDVRLALVNVVYSVMVDTLFSVEILVYVEALISVATSVWTVVSRSV